MTENKNEEVSERLNGLFEQAKDVKPLELDNWVMAAASTIGLLSIMGMAESNPEETQRALDDLFIKMPEQLSIAAAQRAAQAVEMAADILGPN